VKDHPRRLTSALKPALLVALAASILLALAPGAAQARTTGAPSFVRGSALSDAVGTCVVRSLPSFVAQGELSTNATVADVVEVECNPSLYGTESRLKIEDPQLFSACKGNVTWFALNPFKEAKKSIGVEAEVDVDGNATVAVLAGPGCSVAETFVTVHEEEFPFESFFAGFNVRPTQVTPPGLTAMPEVEVEDAATSSFATIVEAEFADAAEQKIRISSEELFHRCQVAPHLKWVRMNGEVLSDTPEVKGVELDNDGNAFVIAIGDASCAEGESQISADEESKPFATELTNFTILPPQPTAEPAFTIEKLQEIKGSGSGFTKSPLVGAIGETVDYQIRVTNTAPVPETFEAFTDPNCDPGTIGGGPGSSAVGPGETTTYTCDHVLTEAGTYTNEAAVMGDTAGGRPVKLVSNQVVVEVPPPAPEPEFTIEKLQQIMGSGFAASPLAGVIGLTVEYEMIVKNTGKVSLTLSAFSDPHCDAGTIAGGPGAKEVAPGATTTYTCDHVLTEAGTYTNEATVTGTTPGGKSVSHTSNQVVVNTPPALPEPSFTIEKLQEIAGSGSGFSKQTLTGEVGQTIDYELVVKNTGNVPLTFSSFSDPRCDTGTIAGGPGATPVAPGASTTYTCSHLITGAGGYLNVAVVAGAGPGEAPTTHESNAVEVTTPEPKAGPKGTTESSPSTTPIVPPLTPPPAGKKEVLAICERLAPLHGASGPKRQTFSVQTSATGIKQITFYLDGHKLKTLAGSQAKHGKFTLKINPAKLSYGAHKLSVKTVMSNPDCKPPARSSVFVRPFSQRAAPKFTG
jgi:hypothetical protein